MKILGQLGLIFAFALGGECMARLITVGIPASVWGLVLLLAALQFGLLRVDAIVGVGSFLAANMAFFFIPSSVSIIDSYQTLHPVLFRLLLVCLVSTVLTFLATYYTVRFVKKFVRRGE